jgi:hypothetical protein
VQTQRLARALAAGALTGAALTAIVAGQAGVPAGPLVITGATLIDGTGAPPAANRTIVIEGAQITAVGPAGQVAVPPNARTVDAAGKFVIPGLIDGHVHWRGWTGELFLNHGVTSVVDLGNPTDWILAARDAEGGGLIRGPRIFTAAGALKRRTAGEDAGSSDDAFPYISYVDGAASARAAVRALIGKGPDVIKVLGDLTADELRAVADEAHKVDLGVVGPTSHAYVDLDAGLDGVTGVADLSATLMTPENQKKYREGMLASPHAWMATDKIDELVTRMAARGTYLTASLIAEHGGAIPQARQFEMSGYDLLMRPELRYVPVHAALTLLTAWHTLPSHSYALGPYPFVHSTPAAVVEEFRRGHGNAQELVRRLAKAGGRIVVGTDAGGAASVPGLSVHQELELLVDAGVTPMQALVSATRTPAEMIRKDYKLGTIAPGKLADLLILDADPLADIRNTRKIGSVIKNGEIVDTRYHRDYHTAFAELEAVGVSRLTHPVPVVTRLVSRTMNQMSQVIHDGSPFELVVHGHGFHSSSLVELNGRPLETSFVSAAELRARVPTERIPVEGTYAVTVFTPWPGGGRSNVKGLSVK